MRDDDKALIRAYLLLAEESIDNSEIYVELSAGSPRDFPNPSEPLELTVCLPFGGNSDSNFLEYRVSFSAILRDEIDARSETRDGVKYTEAKYREFVDGLISAVRGILTELEAVKDEPEGK